MKKARKLITLFLSAAMALSVCIADMTLTGVESTSANAATAGAISVPSELPVGEALKPDAYKGVTHVRTPKGVVVDIKECTFDQAGYYTFLVKDDDGKILFEGFRTKAVVDDGSWKIVEADIPTYAKAGAEIKLPAASYVVEDADAEYEVTCEVTLPDGKNAALELKDGAYTLAADKTETAGAYFVRYTAVKNKIQLVKDYTVQVQDGFEDESVPTLSFSGVPSSGNTRSKVSLPKATATGDFDENVKIEITVTDPNGKAVKAMKEEGYEVYYVDEKGNEVAADEAADAVFDNADNMSFYPTEKGRYVVTYKATSDNGKETKSVRAINVSDKLAPKIDASASALIPAEWGVTTMNAAETVDEFYIPVAYIYDNTEFGEKARKVGGKYVAHVIIKKDSTTIFDSSKDKVEDAEFLTELKEDDGVYGAGSYKFNLAKAAELDKLNGDIYGTYTITYKAVDAQSLVTTKDVKVSVTQESYAYKAIPEVKVSDMTEYLVVGDEFKGFDVSVTSNPGKDENGNSIATASVYTEKNYRFKADGSEDYVEFDVEKDELTEEGTLELTVVAVDPYGNKSEPEAFVVPVIKLGVEAEDAVTVAGEANTEKPVAGKEYNFLGADGLKISTADNEYVGFETYVAYSEDGKAETLVYQKATTEYAYAEDGSLTIKSVKMNAAKAGVYTLMIRGFAKGNVGQVWYSEVTVDAADKTIVNAAANAKEVSVYSNCTVKAPEGTDTVSVKGTRYSVMGERFVPMDAGMTYNFTFSDSEGKVEETSNYVTTGTGASSDFSFKVISSYEQYLAKFVAADYNETLEAEGKDAAMKKHMFAIPDVSVICEIGTVDVEITVTNPSSQNINIETDTEGNKYFRNTSDGVYTVTYAATAAGITEKYELKLTSGDVVIPTFTTDKAAMMPKATWKKGDTFEFASIAAEDNKTASKNITYKRTLVKPDKTTASDSKSGKSDKYTLDQVGTYTVRYEATDEAGQTVRVQFQFEVTDKASAAVNTQVISTVLIICAALLIIAFLVYFFAFRRIDKTKSPKSKK